MPRLPLIHKNSSIKFNLLKNQFQRHYKLGCFMLSITLLNYQWRGNWKVLKWFRVHGWTEKALSQQNRSTTYNILQVWTKSKQTQLHILKYSFTFKRKTDQCWYLLFASNLSKMVENIDDISYSSGCFFNLGGQVDTCHGNNLEETQVKREHLEKKVLARKCGGVWPGKKKSCVSHRMGGSNYLFYCCTNIFITQKCLNTTGGKLNIREEIFIILQTHLSGRVLYCNIELLKTLGMKQYRLMHLPNVLNFLCHITKKASENARSTTSTNNPTQIFLQEQNLYIQSINYVVSSSFSHSTERMFTIQFNRQWKEIMSGIYKSLMAIYIKMITIDHWCNEGKFQFWLFSVNTQLSMYF